MADRPDLLSRRQAMGLLAGLGAGVIAAACGGGSSSKSASSSTTTRTTSAGASGTTASTAACVLKPEVTEGPYYLDVNKIRSDITEGKDGAPLDLKITVVDATGCTPIKDAAVDVWHCDAGGVYSGFSQASAGGPGGGPGGGQGGSQSATDNQTFLRGTQLTDANGLAQFQTIYPGWYRGRAVHIHMKVHVGGSVVHTGQLFFDDGLTDQVYRSAPYSSRGTRDVRNTGDDIYRSAGAASAVLAVTPADRGHAGEITVGVKRT